MSETVLWTLAAVAAYVAGTLASAQIVAGAAGVDITRVGSGNPGASNVTRALGWRRGVLVFLMDAAKGVAGAGVGYLAGGRGGAYLCGAAAILGHVFPLTRRLQGGKGVATAAGTLAVLHPVVLPVVLATWWVVTRVTGMAAIGSLAAVAVAPAGLVLASSPRWEYAATLGICALIYLRHVGNLRRMLGGSENRLGRGR